MWWDVDVWRASGPIYEARHGGRRWTLEQLTDCWRLSCWPGEQVHTAPVALTPSEAKAWAEATAGEARP